MESGSPFKFVSSLFKDPALVTRWRPPIGVRRRECVLSNHDGKTTWNVNDNFLGEEHSTWT